jgi:hypothetical protein
MVALARSISTLCPSFTLAARKPVTTPSELGCRQSTRAERSSFVVLREEFFDADERVDFDVSETKLFGMW